MKSFIQRFFIPAFTIALPSLSFSLYNLTHPEQIQASGILKYIFIIDFIITLLLMLFFIGRYRKTTVSEGALTFKKLFSHAYRIIITCAIFGFLTSLLIAITFKEETKKLSEILLQSQIQEITNIKGTITPQEKQMLEQTGKIMSSPIASSFSYSLSILLIGIVHCLVASALFKDRSS